MESNVILRLGERTTLVGRNLFNESIGLAFGDATVVLLNDEEEDESKRVYSIILQGIHPGSPAYHENGRILQEYHRRLLMVSLQGLAALVLSNYCTPDKLGLIELKESLDRYDMRFNF
jgi:hypothetical protein